MRKEMKEAGELKAREKEEKWHWADGIAKQLATKKPKSKKDYVCAAGITPSGTVHIGNFREVITVELVARALRKLGKKVRFIYSWDNIDRLRKIPKNLPEKKQREFQNYIGMPLTKVPDPFDCHKNYAEHFQEEFCQQLPKVGIFPEFINQAEMYGSCKYAKEIKFVLENKEKIKEILNKYKTEEKISEEWQPVQVYCEKCLKDTTKILFWQGYEIEYVCECGFKNKIDFRKKGIVKLPWRIDWPMRWHFYKVDFEPGGKEHSTPGGSFTTGSEIIREIYKEQPPVYQKYDFIIIKGAGGKISSSLGNVITLRDCLEIYEPQILRYLFVASRPNREFAIAFDADVIKIYAEYDKLEQDYFAGKLCEKERRIYELSQVSEKKPVLFYAPSFRELIELVQCKTEKEIIAIKKGEGKIKNEEDEKRTAARIALVKNWLKKAPQEFKFTILEKPDKQKLKNIPNEYIAALRDLGKAIEYLTEEQQVRTVITEIIEKHKLDIKTFFKAAYLVILGKEEGPRLSGLLILEKEKILGLLKQI